MVSAERKHHTGFPAFRNHFVHSHTFLQRILHTCYALTNLAVSFSSNRALELQRKQFSGYMVCFPGASYVLVLYNNLELIFRTFYY